MQSVTGRSNAGGGAAAKPTTHTKHQLPPLPKLPPMPPHTPSDAEQLREIVARRWPAIQARKALDAVKDSPADTRYLVEDAIRYAMNGWPAGPLDFLLRQNREQNAQAIAAAATAAAIRPEAAPAPVATAVEDLLARHEAAGRLLRACLALHDCDRGQHSSDLLIAVSNIKLAAKRSNRQNGDIPYLDAVGEVRLG